MIFHDFSLDFLEKIMIFRDFSCEICDTKTPGRKNVSENYQDPPFKFLGFDMTPPLSLATLGDVDYDH